MTPSVWMHTTTGRARQPSCAGMFGNKEQDIGRVTLSHYLDSAVAIISFCFSAQPPAAQWGSEALRLLSTNNQTMKAKGSGSDWVSIVPLPNFALSCRGVSSKSMGTLYPHSRAKGGLFPMF